MKLILLSGKMGAGKTTLQNQLIEDLYRRHNRATAAMNFADILYRMHDAVLDVLYEYWPSRDIVKDGPLLQVLGTDWARKTIDQDIWVKCMKNRIQAMQGIDDFKKSDRETIVILGDCRFENEFDLFPEALRVRLECPEDVRKNRCSMWRENTTHPSEISLDIYSKQGLFDLYLDTNNTPPAGCASLVIAQILKGDWVDRRAKR